MSLFGIFCLLLALFVSIFQYLSVFVSICHHLSVFVISCNFLLLLWLIDRCVGHVKLRRSWSCWMLYITYIYPLIFLYLEILSNLKLLITNTPLMFLSVQSRRLLVRRHGRLLGVLGVFNHPWLVSHLRCAGNAISIPY